MPYSDDFNDAKHEAIYGDIPHELQQAEDDLGILQDQLKSAVGAIVDTFLLLHMRGKNVWEDEFFITISDRLCIETQQAQRSYLREFNDTGYKCKYSVFLPSDLVDYAMEYQIDKQKPKTVVVANAGNREQVKKIEVL